MHYHSWCIIMAFLLIKVSNLVCEIISPHLYFTSYCNQDLSEILIWGDIFLLLFSIQNCVHIPVLSLRRILHSQYIYLMLLFKNKNFYEITLSSDFSLTWLPTALQHLPYSSFRNAGLPYFYFSREYRPAFPTSLDRSAFPDRKELSYLMQFSESFLLQQIYINWPYFNNLWQLFHFKPLLYSHLGNLKKGFSKHSHSYKIWVTLRQTSTHAPHTHTCILVVISAVTDLMVQNDQKLQPITYFRQRFTTKAFSSSRLGPQKKGTQTLFWPEGRNYMHKSTRHRLRATVFSLLFQLLKTVQFFFLPSFALIPHIIPTLLV